MWMLWLALGVTWLAFLFIIWIQFQMMRQSGAILSRLETLEKHPARESSTELDPAPLAEMATRERVPEEHGLPVGAPAPSFDLPDLSGHRHTLEEWRGKPLLIVFFSPRCGFCTEIAADLAAMPLDGKGGGPVPLVVTNGTVAENREWVEEYGIRCTVLRQEGMEVANRYQATGTPMGYLVDGEGRIASKMAVGGPNIVDLIPTPAGMKTKPLSESKIARDGLRAGTAAPDFDLPDLQREGKRVRLADYRGRRLLLVFSDPQCGPCDELAPELQKWHAKGEGPALVMVSRGDPAANRAKVKEHGLTFPVGIQKQWEVSKKYAMFATPVAYLVDEDGVIAEEIAVGVDDIVALARRSQAADRREVMA
jgi:peroxiredoxin